MQVSIVLYYQSFVTLIYGFDLNMAVSNFFLLTGKGTGSTISHGGFVNWDCAKYDSLLRGSLSTLSVCNPSLVSFSVCPFLSKLSLNLFAMLSSGSSMFSFFSAEKARMFVLQSRKTVVKCMGYIINAERISYNSLVWFL